MVRNCAKHGETMFLFLCFTICQLSKEGAQEGICVSAGGIT